MNEEKKNLRVGVYCRVSTQEQADSGFGIDVQMNKINSYLTLFDYDVENIKYYIDEGISAKNIKRKEFQKLMTAVKSRELDMVMIYKLDRLSRKVTDVYNIIEILLENNCNLVAIMDKLDIYSANGRMLVGMLAIISQWERETIAERTNDGMIQMAKQGLYPFGGKPPFGYKRVENKLVIDEVEAVLVKDVFNLVIDGRTLQYVRKHLHENGKKYYKRDAIRKILINKLYIGEVTFKDKVYKDIATPIITKDVFIKANERLQVITRQADSVKYYFSTLIKCQSGHYLENRSTNKPNKKYFYYVCDQCKQQRINQKIVVDETLFRLLNHSFKKDYSKEEKKLVWRINEINEKIETTYLDYINGLIDAKVYAFTFSTLDSEKRELCKLLENIKVTDYINWNKMSDHEKKFFVQSNIKEIVVDITLKKVISIEYK